MRNAIGGRILPRRHGDAEGTDHAKFRFEISEAEAAGNYVSVQVYDFSPVVTKFRVFSPISQPQGFDFSAVTRKARNKRFRGQKMKCEVKTNRNFIGNSGSRDSACSEIFHMKEARWSRFVPGSIFNAKTVLPDWQQTRGAKMEFLPRMDTETTDGTKNSQDSSATDAQISQKQTKASKEEAGGRPIKKAKFKMKNEGSARDSSPRLLPIQRAAAGGKYARKNGIRRVADDDGR